MAEYDRSAADTFHFDCLSRPPSAGAKRRAWMFRIECKPGFVRIDDDRTLTIPTISILAVSFVAVVALSRHGSFFGSRPSALHLCRVLPEVILGVLLRIRLCRGAEAIVAFHLVLGDIVAERNTTLYAGPAGQGDSHPSLDQGWAIVENNLHLYTHYFIEPIHFSHYHKEAKLWSKPPLPPFTLERLKKLRFKRREDARNSYDQKRVTLAHRRLGIVKPIGVFPVDEPRSGILTTQIKELDYRLELVFMDDRIAVHWFEYERDRMIRLEIGFRACGNENWELQTMD
jgi:nuclear transport factor 2 (NTF2) superfamily protein